MKRSLVLSLMILMVTCLAFAQEQEKTVSIPESQLTEQQKQTLKLQQADQTLEKAHGWVGIGKELGQAFDQALGSLTTRSNEFAVTPVGKFTMFIVAWKVMGDQAVAAVNMIMHFIYGGIEMIVFLPIILWSYRRLCLPRRILTGKEGPFWARKKTWTITEFKRDDDEVIVAQWAHFVLFILFSIVWLVTVFSY